MVCKGISGIYGWRWKCTYDIWQDGVTDILRAREERTGSMNKDTYEDPMMDVVELETEDVIRTSPGEGGIEIYQYQYQGW